MPTGTCVAADTCDLGRTLVHVLLVKANALLFLGKLIVGLPKRDAVQAAWKGDGKRASAAALPCGNTF